jgi:hypothetical protein
MTTATSRRRAGTSGRARPCQPPRPRRGLSLACPEQGQEGADAPPAHFIKAQSEQGLWEELRDHGAPLNRALNKALLIHSGPAWRVF